MPSKKISSPALILIGWFALLALVVVAVAFLGPSPSGVALLSKSDGIFMTFGSVYALAGIVAVFLSLLLLQWARFGWNSFFELDDAPDLHGLKDSNWLSIAKLWGYGGVSLLACYLILVQPGGTLISTMEHDTFVYYDGAHRVEAGQIQHIDFHTPMGAVCNVFPYWGLRLAGRYAGSMEVASLLAAAFFLGVGIPVVATRYAPAVAIPLVVFLCLLAAVPLGVEETPDQISHSMFYNRFGWGGLTLLFLFFIDPRIPTRATCWLDAFCLAALLFFLFYLKITYFLVGGAFLPLVAFFSPYGRRVVLLAAALFLPAIGLVEYFYGINVPYFQDLLMTIKASGANRGAMIPKLFSNLKDFALVAIAVGMAFYQTPRKLAFVAFAGYVVLAGLAIIDQNTHSLGVICWLAALAAAYETIRRAAIQKPTGASRDLAQFSTVACAGLVLLFVVQPIVFRCTTMAMIRSAVKHATVEMPGGLEGIVFGEQLLVSPTPTSDRRATYLETVLDGTAALQELGTSGKSVTVLDFVNPFSFILDMSPPTGDHTCIHYGRTMSDDNFSPPEELLGSVDYVMIPRQPKVPLTTEFLQRTYGSYLNENFSPIKQTKYWNILSRKSPRS